MTILQLEASSVIFCKKRHSIVRQKILLSNNSAEEFHVVRSNNNLHFRFVTGSYGRAHRQCSGRRRDPASASEQNNRAIRCGSARTCCTAGLRPNRSDPKESGPCKLTTTVRTKGSTWARSRILLASLFFSVYF